MVKLFPFAFRSRKGYLLGLILMVIEHFLIQCVCVELLEPNYNSFDYIFSSNPREEN